MDNRDRERYLLHSYSPQYRRRVAEAKQIISKALSLAQNWYVSCSFGKDSIVLQHLVREQNPNVTVVFIDSGVTMLDKDQSLIDDYVATSQLNLVRLKWDKFQHYRQDQNTDQKGTLYTSMFQPLENWLKNIEMDGFFMGLRRDESVGRLFSIGKHGPIHQYKTGFQRGMWRCVPLHRWKIEDVGSYIVSNNLPLLDIYQKMGLQARSGVFGFGNAQNGRIAYLRQHYPDEYKRFVNIRPDVRNYT